MVIDVVRTTPTALRLASAKMALDRGIMKDARKEDGEQQAYTQRAGHSVLRLHQL